jgi:hypothetical protein
VLPNGGVAGALRSVRLVTTTKLGWVQIRLPLNAVEGEALRDLQRGRQSIETSDPIWNELVELGLVDLVSTGKPRLTLAGGGYRTDVTS